MSPRARSRTDQTGQMASAGVATIGSENPRGPCSCSAGSPGSETTSNPGSRNRSAPDGTSRVPPTGASTEFPLWGLGLPPRGAEPPACSRVKARSPKGLTRREACCVEPLPEYTTGSGAGVTDTVTTGSSDVSTEDSRIPPSIDCQRRQRKEVSPDGQYDNLIWSVQELAAAIRELVTRSPVSSEELLTAEKLAELFRMSPRTLRDLAASSRIPHHRIGKHYRFSRDDIAEILEMTRQVSRARRSRPETA